MIREIIKQPDAGREWLGATLVCGTLDMGYALLTNGLNGVAPGGVLRGIAVGPFGKGAKEWGLGGAAVGLAVHFLIMAAMVLGFLWAVRRWPNILRQPILTGAIYGTLLYVFMYWIVLPLRWPSAAPTFDIARIAPALFPHVVLVGIPMALLVAHWRKNRAARTQELAA